MKLQFLFACLGLFTALCLADAAGPGKDKKSPVPKGKTEIKPAPKTLPIANGVKAPIYKGPDSKKYHELVKKSSPGWKADAGQKVAVDKLLAGQEPLTDQERQQVSDLLFNAKDAGLTQDDETALSYLLLDETARNASATTSNPPADPKTGPLFVRIFNDTGERLKVWVKVVSDEEIKKEKEPDPKKLKPLQYDLLPGKAYDLQQNGERLKASAIRIWAISPTRSWADHRDQDLFLTTPANQSKTYTLTFSK
jgi:hypothetical protein